MWPRIGQPCAQHIIDRFGISSKTTPQELIRIHGYLLNYLVSHLIDADKVMKAGIYYLHLIYEAGIALIPSFADAAQSCWDEIKDPKTWWKSSNIFERVLGKKGFSEIPKVQQDLIRTVHTEDIIKIQGIINIKDIKRLYRQAVFICHPDKGGTAEDFEALTSITKELEENILSLTAGKSANTSQQNTDTTPNSTPQYSTSTTTPVTPANTPVPVSGTPEQPDSATDAFPTDLPSVASMRSNITARAPTPGYSRRLFSWADDGIAKQEQHIFPTPPIVAEGCCPINGMSIANMTTTEEIKELQKKSQAPTTEQHVSGVSSTSNGVVKGAFAYWLTTQPLKLVLEPSSKDHPAIIWFAVEYPILRGLGSMEDKYINGKAFSFSTAMLQAFASDSYLYSSIFGIPLCEINNLDKILIPVASKHYLTANTKSTLEALEYYLPLYILAPELGKYIYLLCERFQDNWFCKPASNFAAFFVMHMSLKIDSDFNFVKNIINTIASAIDSHPLAVSTLASLVNLSILYLKLKPIVVAAKMGTSVSLFVPAPTVWSFASPSIEYFANSFVSGLSGKVVGTTLGTYAGVATITKLSGSGVAMFFSYVPSGTSFVVAAGGIVAATAVAIPAGIGTVLIVDHFITPQVEYATQTDYGKNIGIFTGAIGGAAAGMLVGVKVAAALSFIGIFGVPTIIGLGAGLGTFAALGTLIGMDVGHGVDNIIKCNTPHYEDCPWL